MTNNLRNMLAQYIAGKITVETKNNTPNIDDTSIANNLENYIKTQLNLQGTDSFNISNVLNVEGMNIIAGYTKQSRQKNGPCNGLNFLFSENKRRITKHCPIHPVKRQHDRNGK